MRCMTNPAAMIPRLTDKTLSMKNGHPSRLWCRECKQENQERQKHRAKHHCNENKGDGRANRLDKPVDYWGYEGGRNGKWCSRHDLLGLDCSSSLVILLVEDHDENHTLVKVKWGERIYFARILVQCIRANTRELFFSLSRHLQHSLIKIECPTSEFKKTWCALISDYDSKVSTRLQPQ